MASTEEVGGQTRLRVRVQPKASKNAIMGEQGDRIRVSLTAPPLDGEANRALQVFIAKALGVPKASVTLLAGERSREKTLGIKGLAAGEIRANLLGPLPRSPR